MRYASRTAELFASIQRLAALGSYATTLSEKEACAADIELASTELVELLDARPEVGLVGVRQITGDGELSPTMRRLPSIARSLGHASLRSLNLGPSLRLVSGPPRVGSWAHLRDR